MSLQAFPGRGGAAGEAGRAGVLGGMPELGELRLGGAPALLDLGDRPLVAGMDEPGAGRDAAGQRSGHEHRREGDRPTGEGETPGEHRVLLSPRPDGEPPEASGR